jgi:rhodanese-related sulfurtransferase
MDQVCRGLVMVPDVRLPEEYVAGHLLGAVNESLAGLERCLGDRDSATVSCRQRRTAQCRCGPGQSR